MRTIVFTRQVYILLSAASLFIVPLLRRETFKYTAGRCPAEEYSISRFSTVRLVRPFTLLGNKDLL